MCRPHLAEMIFLWIVQTESPVDGVAMMMISYVQIYNLTLKMQGHVATAACSQRGDFSAPPLLQHSQTPETIFLT